MTASEARRRPSIAARLAVALAVLALGLVAFETVHRYLWYGAGGLSPRGFKSIRPLGDSGLVQASSSPLLRYELKPNYSEYFKLATITTNSRGMRDVERELEKPAGTFRIAVVGDSFTMGSGVEADELYPAVLERRLNGSGDGMRYECLNFGVGGYGLSDYYGVIHDKVLPFSPDLVVIGLCINDQRNAPPDRLDAEFVAHEVERPFFQLSFIDDRFRPPDPEIEVEGPNDKRRVTRELFHEIGQLLAPKRIRVFYAFLTTTNDERTRAIATRFERSATRTNSGFLSTCDAFEGTSRVDFEILPSDEHPNARAHAIYAEMLDAALRDGRWLLPLE